MAGLAGKRVLLGVGGGIAAYKTPELVRRLRDAGADVRVILTGSAAAFVSPLALQAVSGHPVREDLFDPAAEAAMGHIELARWADVLLIAPATANRMARLAQGLADDLLSTTVLATEAAVVIVPAMNRCMWQHPATRRNEEQLRADGVIVLGPASGAQACGETGPGRMLEPSDIVLALEAVTAPGRGLLAGRSVLITAGPTREPLDPVRFLSNHSSGKMGFAIAEAARRAGADVTLVAGPCNLPTPEGVERIDVITAVGMAEAVEQRIAGQDVFIATAAVADYRPEALSERKLKKSDAVRTIRLVPNPDILATVTARAQPPFAVGFAAETHDLLTEARRKRDAKRLDMLCANQVGQPGSGFDADDNQIDLLYRDDRLERLGPGPKRDLAVTLIQRIAAELTGTVSETAP